MQNGRVRFSRNIEMREESSGRGGVSASYEQLDSRMLTDKEMEHYKISDMCFRFQGRLVAATGGFGTYFT
ncbi:hypothetical protein Tco_0846207 [Tanacetum coccineum]